MLFRQFVSAATLLSGLFFAVSTQAAVVPAVGAVQGTAILAAHNGSLEQELRLAPAAVSIHPVLGTPTRPVVKPAEDENQSNIYAMLGLGALGLMVIRRKRYGRK